MKCLPLRCCSSYKTKEHKTPKCIMTTRTTSREDGLNRIAEDEEEEEEEVAPFDPAPLGRKANSELNLAAEKTSPGYWSQSSLLSGGSQTRGSQETLLRAPWRLSRPINLSADLSRGSSTSSLQPRLNPNPHYGRLSPAPLIRGSGHSLDSSRSGSNRSVGVATEEAKRADYQRRQLVEKIAMAQRELLDLQVNATSLA